MYWFLLMWKLGVCVCVVCVCSVCVSVCVCSVCVSVCVCVCVWRGRGEAEPVFNWIIPEHHLG